MPPQTATAPRSARHAREGDACNRDAGGPRHAVARGAASGACTRRSKHKISNTCSSACSRKR
eukprot:5352013-Alexandrium_andersonii.AAC.1